MRKRWWATTMLAAAVLNAAAQTPAQISLDEFAAGKTNVFSTADRTNFQGTMQLTLGYPISWKLGETNVTDNKGNQSRLAVFSNEDGDLFTLALGRNKEPLDREKADKEISKALRGIKVGMAIAPGVKRIASERAPVDGQPGFSLEMTAKDKKKKEHAHLLMQMVLGRTNSVAMIFSLTGSLDQAKELDEKFAAYKPLFDKIIQGTSIKE
jgi:hypothetical protein